MNTLKHVLLAGVCLAPPARAHADLNFDATQVAPDQGIGDPLPSGWYNVAIDESEKKPTEKGGEYLKLRFNVLDGQYAGRKLFEQLNLKNDNPQTVEIAQKQLSAICHAVGVLRPQRSEELHDRPLKVRVGQKPASGGYDAGNKITAYKSKDHQVDMAGGDSSHAGASSFGAGAPSNPWETGKAAEVAGAPTPTPTPPATPTPTAPPAPPAPAAPAAPAAPHDPLAAAVADGWIKHPSAPGYHYKGQDVKLDADVSAMYPAPAAPEAPAAPPPPPAAPSAPGNPQAPATTESAPPWAQPKA